VFFSTKLSGDIAVDVADELGELMGGLYAHQKGAVVTQVGVSVEFKLEQGLCTSKHAQYEVSASSSGFE